MPASSPVHRNAERLAELAALVDAVKERVRAQYPRTTAETRPGEAVEGICVGLPDLTPLARARDAAAGKMAAIGTVNPRPGGLVNNAIQAVKRGVARALNWFVRDQVIFNRQMIACMETCIETMADINRAIHALAIQSNDYFDRVRAEMDPLRTEAEILRAKTTELGDLASHWSRWREDWQIRLHSNEVEFLKSVADLNLAFHEKAARIEAAFQYQVAAAQAVVEKTAAELDASYRKTAKEIEASCLQTASGIQANFSGAIVPLEARFRETVSQTETNFRNALAGVERLTNSHAESIHQTVNQCMNSMDERIVTQAREFERALATAISEVQKKFYGDLDRIRAEYERIIHSELRLVRQRLASAAPLAVAAAEAPAVERVTAGNGTAAFDYTRFADRFRGSEEYVTETQRFYVPYFEGRRHVVDLGCGRGEFLRLMREAGVPARGVESSVESVAYCRSLGLDVENADLFAWLAQQPESSLDGIFCAQVVEHLPAERLAELVRLCARRLATGGILAVETPNPECLAIFASHFYVDPTHTRPVPAQLLTFYMEEFGLGRVEVHPKSPAMESMPQIGELPAAFRERFFDGLDYAILGYRL